MKIVWASSEAVPYAKTGGLADVSASLPEALSLRGHQVSVVMPYYPQQTARLNLTFDGQLDLLGVPFGNITEWASVRILKINPKLTYYFIEFNRFFDRATLYDWQGQEYSDNAQRFIFFSRAVMETVTALRLDPDILHLNDWHCALCAVYLRSRHYSGHPAFRNCRSVMTIHNIGYQGNFDKGNMFWTGLGWDYFNWQCLEFYDRLNLLKGGIMCADMVSTVSHTYAEEILSPEFGFALDPCLRHRAYQCRLRGIANGIDADDWNPTADRRLPARFTPKSLAGKKKCKSELQKKFRLPEKPDAPLFGVLSRLAYQKGLDVFAASLEAMLYHNLTEKHPVCVLFFCYAFIIRMALFAEVIKGSAHINFLFGLHVKEREIDRTSPAVTGMLGYVTLGKELVLVEPGIKVFLHPCIVSVFSPPYEIRHRGLRSVCVVDLKPVAL